MSTLYEKDFYAWCFEQADALRKREVRDIDWVNLIDEVESLGKQQRQELVNRLVILFTHLLKYQFQEELRSKSWFRSILCQQIEIPRFIRKHPSLKATLQEDAAQAYEHAVKMASLETGIPINMLPPESPFPFKNALTEGWLP